MLKKYLILIISLFISALYFNILQFPNKIVTGGLAGISIIINHWFNIEPSNIILIISISLLVIDYLYIGKIQATGAIISTLIYPLFIRITKNIYILSTNLLITSIIIGILSGLTTGIVYKVGFSNGGMAIFSELIAKHFKIRISISSFIVNIIIILLGSFLGIEKVFNSILILIIHCFIINTILKRTG